MARLNMFILMIVLFSSVAFANLPMVEINSPFAIPTLGGYNIWTGNQIFDGNVTINNATIINYEILNVTGNVTAIDFCYLNGTCISDQVSYLNSTISELNDSVNYYSNHNNLNNLDWSVAGHTINTDLDINGYDVNNVDDFNMTGIFRQGVDGNMFIYDSDDEIHHVNVDLTRFDELRSNTFTTDLEIETFCNATGIYINITGEPRISFIGNYLGMAQSESFPESNYVLELYNGTNETPVLNRVYATIVGGEPTWTVSITEPTVPHAMASRVLVGESCNNPYAAALQEDGDNGFLKRVQRRFRKEGLLYENGFDYNASSTYLSIGEGNFINGIYDQETSLTLNSSDGFYLIRFDGTYQWYNSFDEITQYSDGEIIGNNKYFNVIFGITPYDGEGNIYAVVQSKPNTEYTSVLDAYADNDNTLKVYPTEDFLQTFFLPIARMVLNEGNHANVLPSGLYAEDYRGGIAGGVSSGGGLTEADPVWTADKVNYYTKTESNNTYLTLNGSSAYVPYQNATQNVSLGNQSISGASGDFVYGQSSFTVSGTPVLTYDYDYSYYSNFYAEGATWKVRIYGYNETTGTYSTNYVESSPITDDYSYNPIYFKINFTKTSDKIKIVFYRDYGFGSGFEIVGYYLSTNAVTSYIEYYDGGGNLIDTNTATSDNILTPLYAYTNPLNFQVNGLRTKRISAVDDDDFIIVDNDFDKLLAQGGIYSKSLYDGFTIPSGAGTRFMWIPSKGAFRAGSVSGTQWDEANIGTNSFAIGDSNKISGSNSGAGGRNNEASQGNTFVWGQNNKAYGSQNFLFGIDLTSNSDNVFMAGASGTANPSSQYSAHFGQGGTIYRQYTFHSGWYNNLSGIASFGTGAFNSLDTYAGAVFGRFSAPFGASQTTWVSTDPLVVYGNGTSTSARSNSRVIYKNGNDQAMDNVKGEWGTGKDLSIYHDGTNNIFNSTNGLFYFTGANLSVAGINYRSQIDTSLNPLEWFEDGSDYINEDGSINHSYFKECMVLTPVKDYDRPVEYTYIETISDVDEYGNITETNVTKIGIDYPYTKMTEEYSAECVSAKQTNVLSQLNKNINLYENLTDFDSAIMTENIYTQSKTIEDNVSYIDKLKDKDKLKTKETHYAYVENLMGTDYDVLDLEERVVVLEGAVNELFTILCDKNILKKEDGCLN